MATRKTVAKTTSNVPALLKGHQVPDKYTDYEQAYEDGWDGLDAYQKDYEGICYLALGETSKGRCCLIAFPVDGGTPIKMSSRTLTAEQMNEILTDGKSDAPYKVSRKDGNVTIVAA